jgi:hypothetical protein
MQPTGRCLPASRPAGPSHTHTRSDHTACKVTLSETARLSRATHTHKHTPVHPSPHHSLDLPSFMHPPYRRKHSFSGNVQSAQRQPPHRRETREKVGGYC